MNAHTSISHVDHVATMFGRPVEWTPSASDLCGAFDRREFVPWYRPVIDLATGRLGGVAIVPRWIYRNTLSLSSDDFLPAIAKFGLLGTLTQTLLATALTDREAWLKNGRALPLSIEVDPTATDANGLPDLLEATVTAAGGTTDMVTLDLPAQRTGQQHDFHADWIAAFRTHGFGVAASGFRSGERAFRRLHGLPVSGVVVGKGDIDPLGVHPDAIPLLRATVETAQTKGLTVTAEGIESERQVFLLRTLGCDRARGPLYGPARPAKEIATVLNGATIISERAA